MFTFAVLISVFIIQYDIVRDDICWSYNFIVWNNKGFGYFSPPACVSVWNFNRFNILGLRVDW